MALGRPSAQPVTFFDAPIPQVVGLRDLPGQGAALLATIGRTTKRHAGTNDASSLLKESSGAPEERARPTPSFGELHGRILQVSRLATIGEMAAGIAHELNQPLTAIANYARACDRLLDRADSDREDVRKALREIAARALRAGEVLQRLRSLAQSHSMKQEPADINTAIAEIRDLILADARVHGAQVRFELGANLPRVLIDPAQMQHVILNLARNALEALDSEEPSRRELCVRTEATRDTDVEIAVCDTGPGLPAEAVGKLFDPFFSTKSSGTGLGLAISNTVVRAHGGLLCYRANAPRGACFYFRLAAHEDPEEHP
jgi:two-component system, LuxR family, sensor kinase FixL